jgi:hypothetical protein
LKKDYHPQKKKKGKGEVGFYDSKKDYHLQKKKKRIGVGEDRGA